MRTMEESRSISSLIASRRASRKLSVRVSGMGSGLDMVFHRRGVRQRRRLGELDGVLHDGLRLVVELRQLLAGGDAERTDARPQNRDRIALHPLRHFLLRAIL